MKKLILLFTGLLFLGSSYGQIIFTGISPASVQGNYDMTYGETSSGWGGTDLADTTIQDTLVKYLTNTIACTAATNSADIDGHIAILFRGDCEFGAKVKNAQTAGAIAVVIINNIPGSPVGMAPGAAGGNVTIPVVMISDVDGAALLAEMDNGPVEVFMGNKNGFYGDDIGTGAGHILRPQFSSMPSALAADGTEYPINFAAKVYNYGSNDQTNIVLQGSIVYEGDTIYNETSTPIDLLSGDSMNLTLPVFEPSEWKEGYYKLDYVLKSDAQDEYDFDNAFESNFVISPTDLSYASINPATFLPNFTGGGRALDAQKKLVNNYASCFTFKNPNASKLAPSAISFYAIKSDSLDTLMTGESVLINVYEYNDIFTDVNDNGYVVPIDLLNEIMTKEYVYESDLSDTVVTAYFDVNDIMPLINNKRYIFCVTSFNPIVYFGSDSKRNYVANEDFFLQPMFPIGTEGSFDPRGFRTPSVPSISVSFIDAAEVSLKNEAMSITMDAYPSPASNQLNIEFNDNKVNKVELINMMGQTVESQNITVNAVNTTMDVSGINSGVYTVKVHLENNLTHTMRVVVSH